MLDLDYFELLYMFAPATVYTADSRTRLMNNLHCKVESVIAEYLYFLSLQHNY